MIAHFFGEGSNLEKEFIREASFLKDLQDSRGNTYIAYALHSLLSPADFDELLKQNKHNDPAILHQTRRNIKDATNRQLMDLNWGRNFPSAVAQLITEYIVDASSAEPSGDVVPTEEPQTNSFQPKWMQNHNQSIKDSNNDYDEPLAEPMLAMPNQSQLSGIKRKYEDDDGSQDSSAAKRAKLNHPTSSGSQSSSSAMNQ